MSEDGHIVLINQNLRATCWKSTMPTHLVGQVQRQLLSSLPESSRAFAEKNGRALALGWVSGREIPAPTMGARWKWTSSRLPDEQYFGRLWLVRDITGQKRPKPFWKPLAATDALAGLPIVAPLLRIWAIRSGSCPWHPAKRCGADD